MSKVNEILHRKLLATGEEAREFGLNKLANNIFETIGSFSEKADQYDIEMLKENVVKHLWKASAEIMAYYDLESVDAEKLDKYLEEISEEFISEIKKTLNIDSTIGPLEPKLLGQK